MFFKVSDSLTTKSACEVLKAAETYDPAAQVQGPEFHGRWLPKGSSNVDPGKYIP